MKCDIRTVINLDDEDLINLIEKCKEKHKLAELIEKALVAYCYQGEKVPESRRESSGADSPNDLSRELKSLAMQLAVLSNNVQSNHTYTVEALGRLGGEINALGLRGVPMVPQAMPQTAPVQDAPLVMGGNDDEDDTEPTTNVVEVEEEPTPKVVEDTKPEPKQEAVETTEPDEFVNDTKDDAEDEDDEGLSAEAAAALAAFLGGGG